MFQEAHSGVDYQLLIVLTLNQIQLNSKHAERSPCRGSEHTLSDCTLYRICMVSLQSHVNAHVLHAEVPIKLPAHMMSVVCPWQKQQTTAPCAFEAVK